MSITWWGRLAQYALASFLALAGMAGLLWAYYWYIPIPPMFTHRLAIPAKTAFIANVDQIAVRRTYCATRSRRITVYAEIYNARTNRKIVDLRPRERYVTEGCHENELFAINLPDGIADLTPGEYVLKAYGVVHGAHPMERDTVEPSPDVPFTVVWRR